MGFPNVYLAILGAMNWWVLLFLWTARLCSLLFSVQSMYEHVQYLFIGALLHMWAVPVTVLRGLCVQWPHCRGYFENLTCCSSLMSGMCKRLSSSFILQSEKSEIQIPAVLCVCVCVWCPVTLLLCSTVLYFAVVLFLMEWYVLFIHQPHPTTLWFFLFASLSAHSVMYRPDPTSAHFNSL